MLAGCYAEGLSSWSWYPAPPPMPSLQGQLSRRLLVRIEQEQEDRELNAWTTPAIIAAKPNSASKSPS
jgi:hypothetical protein